MFLRSRSPDAETLRWLADLFDLGASSEFKVKLERRKPGKPPKPQRAVVIAAYHFVANVTSETKLDSLLAEAVEQTAKNGTRVALSTLKEYIARHWPDLGDRIRAQRRNG
jgi:hypothetical protein